MARDQLLAELKALSEGVPEGMYLAPVEVKRLAARSSKVRKGLDKAKAEVTDIRVVLGAFADEWPSHEKDRVGALEDLGKALEYVGNAHDRLDSAEGWMLQIREACAQSPGTSGIVEGEGPKHFKHHLAKAEEHIKSAGSLVGPDSTADDLEMATEDLEKALALVKKALEGMG